MKRRSVLTQLDVYASFSASEKTGAGLQGHSDHVVSPWSKAYSGLGGDSLRAPSRVADSGADTTSSGLCAVACAPWTERPAGR